MAHNIWFIAWRNVTRQLRRFITVLLAIVFGIAIISLIQGVLAGINRNIYAAAAHYYGGDVLVLGTRVQPHDEEFAPAADMAALQKLADSYGRTIIETNFRMSVNYQGTIFFDGVPQQQKRINGIDWEREPSLLQDLDLLGHSNLSPSDDSIILSKATAARLKCPLGSSILLQITRKDGQIDTVRLVVWGIYQDAAVFGPYNAYMSRHTLNKVLGHAEGDFSSFAMIFASNVDRVAFAAKFNQEMAALLPTLPIIHSRDEYIEQKFNFKQPGTRYGAVPVDFLVEQLNQLSDALMSGLLVLMVFIAGTVAVGTFNTYRIMLDERSRELGSMRAMGLSSIGLRNMVLVEGLIIAIFGSLAGVFVSTFILNGLSYIPLGGIPGLDLFLTRGHLKPLVSPGQYGLDLSVMVLLLEFSAWMAARRVRNMSPLEAIVRR